MFSNNEDCHNHNHNHNHPSSSSSAPRQDFHHVSQRIVSMSSEPCQGETSDDSSRHFLGKKKRRLKLEQAKALEKSFESGNKLDPQRKVQLARELGLETQQVAIWFQNRRARWKTKKLEKDYDVLRRQVESLRADNDALKSLNKKLHSQLLGLKGREISGDSALCIHSDNNNPIVLPSTNIGGPVAAANLRQVFQPCARPDLFLQEHEGFCSVIGENRQGFWPWPDQQSFH